MLLIVSIPLQVSLSNWIQEHEITLMLWVQKNFQFDESAFQVQVFEVVRLLTRMDAMINFHLISFLISDSLLSYKTTLCYCLGSYMMTVLKLIYHEPRPYWTNTEIKVAMNECDFSYGNPTQATFNFIFFFTYSAYM